jgi:hypothetical protein
MAIQPETYVANELLDRPLQQKTAYYRTSPNLRAEPPRDGIPMYVAQRLYGINAKTQWKLIDEGSLLAGIGHSRYGKRSVLVSRSGVKRRRSRVASRGEGRLGDSVPADGVPVHQLAREFGIFKGMSKNTLREWCEWETHPGLGRKMRSGIGPSVFTRSGGREVRWRGLIVSRSDATACVKLLTKYINEDIPGNPGKWIQDGVFMHNNRRVFFTEEYVRTNRADLRVSQNALLRSYFKWLKSDCLTVTLPGASNHSIGLWRVVVFSVESLDRLGARRQGEWEDGRWDVHGKVWRDPDGVWYSSKLLGELDKLTRDKVQYKYRSSDGLVRFKSVPLSKPNGGKQFGGTAVVHHIDDVDKVNGSNGTANNSKATNASRRKEHAKPQRAKHLKWEHWYKVEKLSYNKIVQREEDETGVRPSRQTVISAIRRQK